MTAADDGLHHTTDIARANLLAASSKINEGVYNVASGVETSLKGLAEALTAMGSDLASSTVQNVPSTA